MTKQSSDGFIPSPKVRRELRVALAALGVAVLLVAGVVWLDIRERSARTEYRDQQLAQIDRRIRELACELVVDVPPGLSTKADGIRARYGCGPYVAPPKPRPRPVAKSTKPRPAPRAASRPSTAAPNAPGIAPRSTGRAVPPVPRASTPPRRVTPSQGRAAVPPRVAVTVTPPRPSRSPSSSPTPPPLLDLGSLLCVGDLLCRKDTGR